MRIVRHHQLTPLKSPAGPLPGCRYSSTVPGTETSRPPDSKTLQPPPGGFTGNLERLTGGRNNSSFIQVASLSCQSFQSGPHPSSTPSITKTTVRGDSWRNSCSCPVMRRAETPGTFTKPFSRGSLDGSICLSRLAAGQFRTFFRIASPFHFDL